MVLPGPLAFNPDSLTYSNLNGFAQDEVHFAHDAVVFTFGSKLEDTYFGKWGFDPSANLLWTPTKRHSFWISAARALRTPSLFEVAAEGPFTVLPGSSASAGLPVLASFIYSPDFTPEIVKDFEAGYRQQVSKTFSIDVAAFYDRYSHLRSALPENPVFEMFPGLHLDASEETTNWTEAIGKGGEVAVAWEISPSWKLEGSYTYNIVDPWISESAPPGTFYGSLKLPSHNKWRLQSYINLSKSWKLDTFLYWTSPGDTNNNYGPPVYVPAYTRLDIRLGYKVNRRWQLSLAGQNLLEPRHLEAIPELLSAGSYVDRGAYLKSTFQF